MAALFTAASTQYLVNSASPLTGPQFTVGMWINLTAVGAVDRMLFAISDTAVTNHYIGVRMLSTENMGMVARAGGTENVFNFAPALTAGTWNFIVARVIANNNRRMSLLAHTGGVTHGSSSTSRTVTGVDTMTLGCLSTSGGITEPWDGLIGEFWLMAGDVAADSAANLPDDLVRQLAYGGPFSLQPMIGNSKHVIEYRSLRKHPASDGDVGEECHFGGFGRQTWVNTNGVTTAHHPPLPYWYVKPGQVTRHGLVI